MDYQLKVGLRNLLITKNPIIFHFIKINPNVYTIIVNDNVLSVLFRNFIVDFYDKNQQLLLTTQMMNFIKNYGNILNFNQMFQNIINQNLNTPNSPPITPSTSNSTTNSLPPLPLIPPPPIPLNLPLNLSNNSDLNNIPSPIKGDIIIQGTENKFLKELNND